MSKSRSILKNPLPTSPEGLRKALPDETTVYRTITENKDVGDFIYDPDDTTSPDDSVMTIRNGKARFKRVVPGHINLKWFEEMFSDTGKAMNAAFTYAKNNRESITLYIPKGIHRIYSTCEFDFGTDITVNLIGEAVSGRSSGSTFLWCGEAGGTMFRFKSMFMSRFENADFIGREGGGASAKYLIHFEWVSGGLTTLLTFRKCTFGGAAGNESASVNINATGVNTNRQVDEVTFDDCFFAGNGKELPDSLRTWYGVIIGGNNTKNFTFNHNHFVNASRAAIKALSGIGQLRSYGNLVGGCGIHFDLTAATTLTSIGDYTETNGMLLRAGIGSTGWSAYIITGYENHADNYDGKYQEFPVTHPYIIEGQGNLLLQGCTFNSGRNQAKIHWITDNGIQCITAMNCNFFGIAPGLTPFYSSGKPLFKADYERYRVVSLNNIGIDKNGISAYPI